MVPPRSILDSFHLSLAKRRGSLFQRPNEGSEPRPSSSYGVDQVSQGQAL